MWLISHTVKKGDYLYAVVKDHPKAIDHGYVLHHRVVMENHLGRMLESNEIVHHKDHNKNNNTIDNLEVMTVAEHTKLHHPAGKTYIDLVCPVCSKSFKREKRNFRPNIIAKCSRSCNGLNSRNIQLGRI